VEKQSQPKGGAASVNNRVQVLSQDIHKSLQQPINSNQSHKTQKQLEKKASKAYKSRDFMSSGEDDEDQIQALLVKIPESKGKDAGESASNQKQIIGPKFFSESIFSSHRKKHFSNEPVLQGPVSKESEQP
jgi:hypothetical protein